MIKIFLIIICISLVCIGIWFIVKKAIRENAGWGQTQIKLIHTLEYIVKILNKSKLTWAIAFGTLLGLKRDGNPVPNDDDIDILIPIEQKQQLVKLLQKHKIKITDKKPIFIQCGGNKNFAQIDFYLVKKYNKDGYDSCIPWEKFPIKLYPIKQMKWHGLKVNIPQGDIKFLKDDYQTWMIRDKGKGKNKKRPKCK